MRTGICILVLASCLASVGAIQAFYGRIGHSSANADARRPALGDHVEIEESAGKLGFAAFARREQIINDRTLTNALGVAVLPVRFPGHEFRFGLGTHFAQQALLNRRAEAGTFSPAGLIGWTTNEFRLELAGGEKFMRAAASWLIEIGRPIELACDFEHAFSQPYRFSTNAYLHVSRYAGLIAGYEPLAARSRAGLWLKPVGGLQISTVTRLHTAYGAEWEFALSYQFESHTDEAPAIAAPAPRPARQQRARSAPAFATLVKWGLTPVEALRFTREKNACNLGAASQAILHKHHWECRRDA